MFNFSKLFSLSFCFLAITLSSCNIKKPSEAESHFDEGKKQFISKNYLEAINSFNQAIDCDDDSAKYYLSRGVAKICIEDYKSAVSDLNLALGLNPNDAQALYIRGSINYQFLNEKTKGLFDLKKASSLGYKDAIEQYDEIMDKYYHKKDSADVYMRSGVDYINVKDYSRSLECINKAISLNPKLCGAYYIKAKIMEQQGNYQEAIANCNKAIAYQNSYSAAYRLRGQLYKNLAKWDLENAYQLGEQQAAQDLIDLER